MFLKLYERGLAYRATGLQWWCPICGALANEEVNADGTDWRDHADITQRELTQWFFKITDYADQLIDDLEGLDWPDETRSAQVNWIGRSEGADVVFATEDGDELPVFTTRPDTLFGATFMVLAPEHPLVSRVTTPDRAAEVGACVAAAARKAELERVALDEDKTGVFTGGYAVNPVNGERLPIWIADYVLMSYGSGAIMAVPAHDQRDFDFATKYGLTIRTVIAPPDWEGKPLSEAFLDDGPMVNSGQFDGIPSIQGIRAVTEWLRDEGTGDFAINYKLRDWLISRQRYWGTPIPIVHCDACGEVPVPEDQLPVLLPHLDQIDPQNLGGRSPLEADDDWVNTACPSCGAAGRRETDTLGGFACSSWYFLRFCSPDQQDQAFDLDAIRRWMPVDLYVGGGEHRVMHLLYARFWTKALRDAGVLDLTEPFKALRHQGLMLAQPGWVDEATLRIDSQGGARVGVPDGADAYDHPESAAPFRRYPLEARFELTGERAQRNGQALVEFRATKMSKSWRNVVTPDEVARDRGRRRAALLHALHGAVRPHPALERAGPGRRIPLAGPRLERGAGPARGRHGSPPRGLRRHRGRVAAPLAPDDPPRQPGHRHAQVQHDDRRPHGVHEFPGRGGRRGSPRQPHLVADDRDTPGAAGAQRGLHGRGAVGAHRSLAEHPPANVARVGPGTGRR